MTTTHHPTRPVTVTGPRAFLVAACAASLTLAACGGTSDLATSAGETDTVESPSQESASEAESAAQTSTDRVETHLDEGDLDWDAGTATKIRLGGTTAEADADTVVVTGSKVTITSAGTYVVRGTLGDGSIVVDTADEGLVRLVLDGADITSTTGPAVQVVDADEVVVILAEASSNRLVGGVENGAALDSTADLTIAGAGSLTVDGTVNDAIASSDGLAVVDASITVEAVDDGIRGKDYLVVEGATLDLDVGGDGLISNNTDAARGFVTLDDVTVTVVADGDGLQAESDLDVTGGRLEITSGGGAGQPVADDASAKGLKAGVALVIDDAVLVADAADDAVHSNDTVTVVSGDLTLATGDDGIHADTELTLSGGTIDVTESYEGLESAVIAIEAGEISLRSSDDGINVSGGADGSGFGPGDGAPPGSRGGPGTTTDGAGMGQTSTTGDQFTDSGDQRLTISGGTILVDADGDGVDANGAFVLSGGSLTIHGPTMQGNGALDADSIEVSGGVLLAGGSAGMAQAPGAGSSQPSLGIRFGTGLAAGSTVTVTDQDGTTVATFTTTKQTETLVVSTPDLESGDTYTVAVDGTALGSLTAS